MKEKLLKDIPLCIDTLGIAMAAVLDDIDNLKHANRNDLILDVINEYKRLSK